MRKDKVIVLPSTPREWIGEISVAYLDAHDAMPFGPLVGQVITENDLFQMAPQVCLKFRGIKASRANTNRATDAMLTSYVATRDHDKKIFNNPHIAFSFAYLASHFGMDLLSESQVGEIMDYIESHASALAKGIGEKKRKKNG